MIKYIIFDFGKVLGYPKSGHWFITPKFLELISNKNVGINTIKEIIFQNKNLVKDDLPIHNLEQELNMFINFYTVVLNVLGLDTSLAREIAYDKVYNNNEYALYKDVKDILSKLKDEYTLIMLTDNFPSITNYLKYEDIYNLFDRIYISSIYETSKKENKFFDLVLTEYGISGEETIFIDDSEANLDVGSKHGMNVLMLDRENKKESKYTRITNLNDLIKICNMVKIKGGSDNDILSANSLN